MFEEISSHKYAINRHKESIFFTLKRKEEEKPYKNIFCVFNKNIDIINFYPYNFPCGYNSEFSILSSLCIFVPCVLILISNNSFT